MLPPETCNGSDDDCDGEVDEGFDCEWHLTRECETSCGSTGWSLCDSSCRWGECHVNTEACNGVDDDCNEVIDDGFECGAGLQVECETECGTTGTRTCTEECTIPTTDSCQVPDEICNGIDDDCDGEIDEDFTCPAGGTGDCITSCSSTGERFCTESCEWDPTCTILEESCTGIDDDCDGFVDENHGLHLVPTRVSDSTRIARSTDLAFSGSEFGLTWSEYWGGISGYRVHFARVALDGTTTTEGVRLTATSSDERHPNVEWTGSRYAVAWTDDAGSIESLRVAILQPSGVMDGSIIDVASPRVNPSRPGLTYTGSGFGIVWTEDDISTANDHVMFVSLSIDGTPAGLPTVVSDDTSVLPARPDIAWNGERFLIAWDYFISDFTRMIKTRMIEHTGVFSGPENSLIDHGSDASQPSLTWGDSYFGMAWVTPTSGARRVWYTLLDNDGDLTGVYQYASSNIRTSNEPRMTWNGVEFALTWCEISTGTSCDEIWMARFRQLYFGTGDAVLVTDHPADSSAPAIVVTTNGYGISWEDERFGDSEIMLAVTGCVE